MHLVIPTLSGGDPYLVPDYLRVEHGRLKVKLANGVSSKKLDMEQNQAVPVNADADPSS